MSCEMISSRKIDYYVNDPYAVIIDIREEEKYKKAHIKGAVNIEYELLSTELNRMLRNGKASLEFRRYFGDRNKIYVFYCDKGAVSLIVCDKMSKLGYNCKSIVGGFDAYKGGMR